MTVTARHQPVRLGVVLLVSGCAASGLGGANPEPGTPTTTAGAATTAADSRCAADEPEPPSKSRRSGRRPFVEVVPRESPAWKAGVNVDDEILAIRNDNVVASGVLRRQIK